MSNGFQDKIAVVTGGSRGIGRAIVLKLTSLGARVIFNYTSNEDAANSVIEEVHKNGGNAEAFKCDVSQYDQVTESFNNIIEKYKSVHILVNNAGINKDCLLARMKEDDWDRIIDVNLKGVFNCCKAIITQMMKQRWGRIVNIGSVVGSMGNPGQVNYAASKAGIIGLSRSLAKEVAIRGITVNVIAPGFIETDMTAAISEKVKKQLLSMVPAGRLGQAEEIAEAVTFLAGENASYITGEVLHINGGLYMG